MKTLGAMLLCALLAMACGRSDARTARAAGTPAAPVDTALTHRVDRARIEGSPSAPVWLVEVSDFQCPYCKEWHDQTYDTIKRTYVDAGKVRLAYVNFPLPIHKNAWPAAEAAMCAAAQDRFWPMHDALFATQDRWGPSGTPGVTFDSLARAIGVDTAAFRRCTTQHETRALIQADQERASESGVESTPSFLLGGAMIRGAQPTAVFTQAIDAALARAGAH